MLYGARQPAVAIINKIYNMIMRGNVCLALMALNSILHAAHAKLIFCYSWLFAQCVAITKVWPAER
jgi:hypothetical protein